MRGTRFAEWLLRRVTTPEHAAAQVGDLLELSRSRGSFWFWRAVLSNVVYGGFRFTLAFLSAFAFSQIIAVLWNHGALGNRPDLNSVYTLGILILGPLWMVPVFLLLRFGWRDAHARFTLLLAFLVAGSWLSFPHPILRWVIPAAGALIASFVLAKTRRDHRALLQSVAQLGAAVGISLGGLAFFLLSLVCLWAVLSYLLDLPETFFRVSVMLSAHPVNDLINALVCLLIVRASERLRKPGRPLRAA
jgi:hypothetical protein